MRKKREEEIKKQINVPPPGIEPGSAVPQTAVLSVELRERIGIFYLENQFSKAKSRNLLQRHFFCQPF